MPKTVCRKKKSLGDLFSMVNSLESSSPKTSEPNQTKPFEFQKEFESITPDLGSAMKVVGPQIHNIAKLNPKQSREPKTAQKPLDDRDIIISDNIDTDERTDDWRPSRPHTVHNTNKVKSGFERRKNVTSIFSTHQQYKDEITQGTMSQLGFQLENNMITECHCDTQSEHPLDSY